MKPKLVILREGGGWKKGDYHMAHSESHKGIANLTSVEVLQGCGLTA